MNRSRSRLPLLLLGVLGCMSVAQARVYVIAAGGGGSFTTITAGVAAASDGDVLLVKAGTYAGFTVADKELTIVADAGVQPVIQGQVLIDGLAATRSASLTGLKVRGPIATVSGTVPAVRIRNCNGSVRVQGCDIAGRTDPFCSALNNNGSVGVVIENSQDVAFARCRIAAGDASSFQSPFGYAGWGAPGLGGLGVHLALYDCDVHGGKGGSADVHCDGTTIGTGYAGYGGCAATIEGSSTILFSSRSRFLGGDGGDSLNLQGCWGAGMLVRVSAAATTLDCTVTRGNGNVLCGPPADVWTGFGGTYTALTGTGRTLTMNRVARENTDVRVQLTGQPGDVVDVVLSDRPAYRTSSAWVGVDLLDRHRTAPIVQSAVIGPSGTLEVAWPVPDLPGPFVLVRRFFAQASFRDTSGVTTMSTPETLVLLDSIY